MEKQNTNPLLPEKHYKNLAQLESSYWWHQSRIRWAENIIREHVRNPQDLDVLDYACGTGGFLNQLNTSFGFRNCKGVDISRQAIDAARKYGDFFEVISPSDLTHVSGKDLILLMDVLEHIEDDYNFIKTLLDRMKEGSYLLISVPAFQGLYSSWDKTLGHFRRYTHKTLKQLVVDCGGQVIYKGYGFSYMVPIIYFKRKVLEAKYIPSNCEFPPVSPFLNRLLLMLNQMEIWASQCISIPFGSSLFYLVQKIEKP